MNSTMIRLRAMNFRLVTVIFVFCLIVKQVSATGAKEELFPVPENLESNIKFWVNTYTLYSSDQIIIHDNEKLDIVYEIVDFSDSSGNDKISYKAKWKEAEKVKKKYRTILNKLSRQKKIQPELLSAQERYVYNLFQPDPTRQDFKNASNNIRGQQGLSDRFREGLVRSGLYTSHMEEIFSKYDLPLELVAIPYVESLFNYKAYSKVGAAGIWQFTRSTGRRFLKINYTVDERFDPIHSTDAAARLLKENYETLNSWPLAVTAYNHGLYGMKRAVNKLKTRDFGVVFEKYQSRSFKFASKNFYAEVLAALEVRKNYQAYFGNVQFEAPIKYTVFNVPNYVKLSTLAKKLNFSIEEIKSYNPSLRKSVIRSKRRLPKGFQLKLPYRENFDPVLAYQSIPDQEKYQSQLSSNWYQVEKGDHLEDIAIRFNTNVNDLMALNDIKNPNQIYVGQVIVLRPDREVIADNIAPKKNVTEKSSIKKPDIVLVSKPKPEAKILAQKTALGSDNDSQPEKLTLQPHQAIVAQTDPKIMNESTTSGKMTDKFAHEIVNGKFGNIVVQPEETLGHFADWLGIPTRELRKLNDLRYGENIHVNQKIQVAYRNVSAKEFNLKRLEYHRAIEEDFFAMYRVDGIKLHYIKSGENIWYLCNEIYDVPYWLVAKYNPNSDLQRLKTGVKLMIPNIILINDSAE